MFHCKAPSKKIVRKINGATKEKARTVDRVRISLSETQVRNRERRALRAFKKMPLEAQERTRSERAKKKSTKNRQAYFKRIFYHRPEVST